MTSMPLTASIEAAWARASRLNADLVAASSRSAIMARAASNEPNAPANLRVIVSKLAAAIMDFTPSAAAPAPAAANKRPPARAAPPAADKAADTRRDPAATRAAPAS